MARFHPSYANKFYKIAEIHYILKVKFECEDIAKQTWHGVSKSDRIAPISGLGGRWFSSLNMRLNQHPVTRWVDYKYMDYKYINYIYCLMVFKSRARQHTPKFYKIQTDNR